MKDKLRLLLVDDHAYFRDGLARQLRAHPVFEVAGRAASARDAVRQACELHPDIVLLDAALPDDGSAEAARGILAGTPDCHIILLADREDDGVLLRAMREGARGYLSKQVPFSGLIAGLYAVGRGESLLRSL